MAAFDLDSIAQFLMQAQQDAEPAYDPSQIAALMGPNTDQQDYGSILSDLQNQLQGLQPHRSFLQRTGMALANSPSPQYQPNPNASWLQNALGGAAQQVVPAVAQAVTQPMQEEDERLKTVRSAAASLATHRWDALKQRQTAKAQMVQRLLAAKKPVPAKPPGFTEQRPGESDADYTKRIAEFKRATEKPASTTNPNDPNGVFDPKAIAARIAAGDFPPDSRGYSRGQWGQIASSLPRGFNLMKAETDYNSLKRHFLSLNGPVQVRLQQSISNIQETVPLFLEASQTLSKLAPRYRMTPLNKLANLSVRELGSEEAVRAAQALESYARTLKFEMAVMYRNGNAPDDAAMKEAGGIINGDVSPERIGTQGEVALRESRIRQHAINDAGTVSPSNPAGVGGAAGTYVGPNMVENSQAAPPPGAKVRMRSSDGKQTGMVDAVDMIDAIQRGWKVVR